MTANPKIRKEITNDGSTNNNRKKNSRGLFDKYIKIADYSEGDTLVDTGKFVGVEARKSQTGSKYDVLVFDTTTESIALGVTGNLRKMDLEEKFKEGKFYDIDFAGKKPLKKAVMGTTHYSHFEIYEVEFAGNPEKEEISSIVKPAVVAPTPTAISPEADDAMAFLSDLL